MVIVDSHCHVSDCWYEPVDVLVSQMDRNGVAHAVLIQMNGQTNNAYQAACIRKYPGRFASVVIVDTERADAPTTLAQLAKEGASGVRLNPKTRSPGDDPFAIWRAAARHGLAVSCGGAAADFASPQFAALVQAIPEVRIVVEHLGALNHPVDAAQEELRRRVFGLAQFPNVAIKIHGLGEFCRRAMPITEPFPFEQPIPSLLEDAFQAFGPNRIMWGSDYPPVSGREGYHLALRLPMEQLQNKSEADRAAIFGGTALATFPVRG